MTNLEKYKTDKEELKELLIKNLPNKIKAGNDKGLSNIYKYKTALALHKCKFINFNTKERISFMIFDIDEYNGKTALAHFKNVDGLYEFISEKIGYEPTYILQTDKGFHFGFHLKNHIFTHQKKALKYLLDIKRIISELLSCDKIASHKLYGVWRNPLLHNCYYSKQINYELSDFRDLIPKIEYKNKSFRTKLKVDDKELVFGKRNNTLFKYAMRFAKNETTLTVDNIYSYIEDINKSKNVDLPDSELLQISKSAYKYWLNGTILFGKQNNKENINEGVMNFEKMKGLTYEEYLEEIKIRQKLSANRTNKIRNKEKNKQQLLEAKRLHIIRSQEKNMHKVYEAIAKLEEENKKVNISSVSKICFLDRRTVKKYFI